MNSSWEYDLITVWKVTPWDARMVLLYKVLLNHISKPQILVLHYRITLPVSMKIYKILPQVNQSLKKQFSYNSFKYSDKMDQVTGGSI